jgi:hypothetical protein
MARRTLMNGTTFEILLAVGIAVLFLLALAIAWHHR